MVLSARVKFLYCDCLRECVLYGKNSLFGAQLCLAENILLMGILPASRRFCLMTLMIQTMANILSHVKVCKMYNICLLVLQA